MLGPSSPPVGVSALNAAKAHQALGAQHTVSMSPEDFTLMKRVLARRTEVQSFLEGQGGEAREAQSAIPAAAVGPASEMTAAEGAVGNSASDVSRMPPPPKQQQRPPWRKVLWQSQPYADNHVDQSFMEHLVKNANVKKLHYWELVQNTAAVTQQVSATAIFFIVFMHVHCDAPGIRTNFLLVIDIVLLLFGYALRCSTQLRWPETAEVASSLKSCALFAAILHLISPVLRTLTESFSDDTIWALSLVLTAVHLGVHDFSYVNYPHMHPKFTGTLSLNAAIFTAVLLSSRLNSNEEVFAFIFFAIELFAYFPITCHHIKGASIEMHIGVTFLLVSANISLLFPISTTIAWVYVFAMAAITFVLPWIMVQNQKHAEHQVVGH